MRYGLNSSRMLRANPSHRIAVPVLRPQLLAIDVGALDICAPAIPGKHCMCTSLALDPRAPDWQAGTARALSGRAAYLHCQLSFDVSAASTEAMIPIPS